MHSTSQLMPNLLAGQGQDAPEGTDRKALSAGDKCAAPGSQTSSIDSEMQHNFEKQRDTEYERQLRVFYKNMTDCLSKETLATVSNEASGVCQ